MEDEIWTMKDGSKIQVGEMTEDHAKNALRMVLRNRRKKLQRAFPIADESFGGQDNHAILADLQAKHGDAVRVEREGVAGMNGGNVYVNGEWRGWYGGI